MRNEGDKFLEWTKRRQEPLYIPSFVYCGVIAKTKTNRYESTRCHLTHRKGTDIGWVHLISPKLYLDHEYDMLYLSKYRDDSRPITNLTLLGRYI